METPKSITEWAIDTFGRLDEQTVALRMNKEVSELLTALHTHSLGTPEEIADIAIMLFQVAYLHGIDLQAEVDRKMAINRARSWERGPSGDWQHA